MELLLEQGELLDLGTVPKGSRVLCRDGCCWLTMAGDSRDHILRPGAAYVSTGRGHLLVTALAPCRLALESRQPAVRPLPIWARPACGT